MRVDGDDGGRFPFTGTGDVNTYALFAELFSCLVGAMGRAGVIVPTGIATDDTTKVFFRFLVEKKHLVSLFSFKEIRAHFQATDDRKSFCLLTLAHSVDIPHFAFSLDSTSEIIDSRRNFSLSPEQIAALNPNTRTAPVFRSRKDAELTARIYANAPVLIEEAKGVEGNPWGVSFMAMFHMPNDSGLFRTAAQLAEAGFVRDGTDWVRPDRRYVPLYEAKMIHQFDHRFGDASTLAERPKNSPWPRVVKENIQDPQFEISPWYWVDSGAVSKKLSNFSKRNYWITFRSIARTGDERTIISTAIAPLALSGKLPVVISQMSPLEDAALLGLFNSLVVDFIARLKVGGTDLAFHYVKQLPIIPPTFYTPDRLAFITPRVLELTYTSHSLAAFARDLGHDGPPFKWDEARRTTLRADLDAFYARA